MISSCTNGAGESVIRRRERVGRKGFAGRRHGAVANAFLPCGGIVGAVDEAMLDGVAAEVARQLDARAFDGIVETRVTDAIGSGVAVLARVLARLALLPVDARADRVDRAAGFSYW